MTNLYLDCEWFLSQKIFLIGYGYTVNNCGQLYGRSLTKANFLRILKPVDGYIFFYGPDIGMLEKHFGINIRNKYKCVNLLKVFRRFKPGLKSYRLSAFEKLFRIVRTTPEYKQDIFAMLRDWHNPNKRQKCLTYNLEDVQNLIRVKHKAFNAYGIRNRDLEGMVL